MINNIYIKDFAIIDEISLSLREGLTAITGETGSGKSILLQALNVSLGGKTLKTMVRSNTERAIVETELKSDTYRRILNRSGRTKSFVNDEPFSEQNFRIACSSLVDFHGQHEQQFIMNEDSHIDYLDSFCGINTKVNKCIKLFGLLKKNEKDISILTEKKQNAIQRQELLNFQLNEISAINPLSDEDIELEKELATLKHFEEILEIANKLSLELTDDDESIYNRLSIAQFAVDKLSSIDQKLDEYAEIIRSTSLNIQELSVGITDYVNSLNHDKNRLIEIQDRLGAIDNLKRKYGGSIEAILATKSQIEEDMTDFSSLDEHIQTLNKLISENKIEYQKLAIELHNYRTTGIIQLSEKIANEMSLLNMPEAKFDIQITQKLTDKSFINYKNQPVIALEKGIDNVRFLLSANPGEQLKPLVEIASGGEISRIMLAIKTVFQKNDPIDTLVFDEIDSGISGFAAEKVAQSLLNLAHSKQVICITHLPQIAQNAMNHLHISKSVVAGKTIVTAKYLNGKESRYAINQLSIGSQTIK